MAELQHVSHGCTLTSPKKVENGICNICYKDKPVEFTCDPCNFDLCKTCSYLPNKVYHSFHSDHPLEFVLRQNDQTAKYIICSGCGNMSSGSYYKCKYCEIYLDLACALMEDIFRSWDIKEMLHNNHAHLVKRCRPGPDASGSCLLCELPLAPSAICYGCVHCYLFFHERCLDLPTEIRHPVHPPHPLKRFDYIQSCGGGRHCNACGGTIHSVPFGCLECDFKLHLRCADRLLRGLMHHSHPQHKLLYSAHTSGTYLLGNKSSACPLCRKYCMEPFFYCIQCDLRFHFECLGIPQSVVNKSYHIHPLVRKIYQPEDDSLEYCGVCELVVKAEYHIYSCDKCDFLGHLECILRKGEAPSPLYLKDLYSCGQSTMRPIGQDDCKTIKLENKLMVNSVGHTHVLRLVDLSELGEHVDCNICNRKLYGKASKCETCKFQTHNFCAELGLPLRHRFHSNHPLTLLPGSPVARVISMNCDICRKEISGFNLFCRICGFIIHVHCVLRDDQFLGTLYRGQKLMIRSKEEYCLFNHQAFEATVSSSYPTACTICEERLCGKIVSCVDCREVYHPWCIQTAKRGGKLRRHPLHPDHKLRFFDVSGSKCTICKLKITKYAYSCRKCSKVSFHFKCINAVGISKTTKYHSHILYNFSEEYSTRVCSVCARHCGVSFYGCDECKFSAHVECVGFPTNVKNQRHQHIVEQTYSWDGDWKGKCCSLCGSECHSMIYSCKHCKEAFHPQCIMSTVVGLEGATEEDQR